jgi:thioredoxin 1
MPTQFFFDKDGKPYIPEESSDIQFILYESRETGEVVFTAHEGALDKDEILSVLEDLGVE